jgi:hypothetical protein
MTNPVGAISFNPQVAQAPAPAAKPAANVPKATPQDRVNISAAGKAASQAQPALKASGDVNHDGDSK